LRDKRDKPNRPMKILLISACFPPDTGSASHLFYELGMGLAKKGHEVQVLTGFPSYHAQGDLAKYRGKRFLVEKMDGMEVMRTWVLDFPRHIPMTKGLWQFSCATFFTLSTFHLSKVDVSIVYSPPLTLGYSALTLKKRRGVPFILNVQDLFPQSLIDLGIIKDNFFKRFFEGMERRMYQYADLITVHSSGNQDHVVKKGADRRKVKVVPNWVDTDFIRPGERMNGFRKKYGLGEKFVVSFAGVLGYSQDVDVILGAAKLLQDKRDMLFIIVGDGVEKERLMGKANLYGLSNVLFVPMQPREVYPSVLQASDISLATLYAKVKTPVVPSKILSIMAAGRPVIACMNLDGDAPKLIEETGCGFCLPPEDPEKLAHHILRLYKDEQLREEMGRRGRNYAEEKLSLKVATDKYLELMEKVRKIK